jgi:hypothetical protein
VVCGGGRGEKGVKGVKGVKGSGVADDGVKLQWRNLHVAVW